MLQNSCQKNNIKEDKKKVTERNEKKSQFFS